MPLTRHKLDDSGTGMEIQIGDQNVLLCSKLVLAMLKATKSDRLTIGSRNDQDKCGTAVVITFDELSWLTYIIMPMARN